MDNIKLNPNSPNLQCDYFSGMKKCTVPIYHFIGRKNGYYDTYHVNHQGDLSINYEVNAINVKLSEEDIIEMYVNDEDNNNEINIGQKGLIYFISNFTDNENIFDISDIEEKTQFETQIADQNYNNYLVTCRLWKPINEKIRIFCQLNEELKQNKIKIYSSILSYKGKKIAIISEMNFVTTVNKINSTIPFLYSDGQIINLENQKNSYDIIFKIGEYNSEKIILIAKGYDFNNLFLDKCNTEGKNLICKITKEKIIEILGFSGQIFKCVYFNEVNGKLFEFGNILDIIINYNNIQKENIYIGITKLFTSYSSIYHYFVYETNITSINNIISNKFSFQFNEKKKQLVS